MNRNSAGFSLIEFIIYCAASVTLIMAFMYYTTTMHMRFKKLNKKSLETVSLYGALTHLISSLETAPTNTKSWKRITATEIIYMQDNRDYGWCVVDNRFVNILGKYALREQRWISKNTYPLITGVQSCNFAIHNRPNNQIESITLTLKNLDLEDIICIIDLKSNIKQVKKTSTH